MITRLARLATLATCAALLASGCVLDWKKKPVVADAGTDDLGDGGLGANDQSDGGAACGSGTTCGFGERCDDTLEVPRCVCSPGFEPGSDDQPRCVDIDECENATDDLCGRVGRCANLEGSFTCACAPGYAYEIGKGCVDLDECSNAQLFTCPATQQCANEEGGYRCECVQGFVPNDEGRCRGDVVFAAAGGDRTCAILSDGSLWCWGAEFAFDVGSPDSIPPRAMLSPQRVGNEVDWRRVALGRHTCGIREGRLYCWGKNDHGQLGDGTTEERAVPTLIDDNDDWVDVAVSLNSSCGLRTGGELYCWGAGVLRPELTTVDSGIRALRPHGGRVYTLRASNELCSPTEGCGLSQRKYIDYAFGTPSGGEYECGLAIDGSLWCLEVNEGMPTMTLVVADSGLLSIAVGGRHGCGIDAARQVRCWGVNAVGQAGGGQDSLAATPVQVKLPNTAPWRSVVAGNSHSCAVSTTGEMLCWGGNGIGQLGRGTRGSADVIARVGTASDWTDVSTGDARTCGIRAGKLYCWGVRLGRSDHSLLPVVDEAPRRVGTDDDWADVDVMGLRACARKTDDRAFCWGTNDPGASDWSDEPIQVDGEWSAVSAGANATGIRNGTLQTWRAVATPVLEQLGTASDWTFVTGRVGHACGLRGVDGSLACWGANFVGQLGDGSTDRRSVPVDVATGYSHVAIGYMHIPGFGLPSSTATGATCGISDGALFCWGTNVSGQLGTASNDDVFVPTRVGSSARWTDVDLGDGLLTHTCGVENGAMYCWGSNFAGELAAVDVTTSPTPIRIGEAKGWTKVSAGGVDASGQTFASGSLLGGYTCGIRAGQLHCWGDNTFGQLGVGRDIAPATVEWN